MNTNTTTGKTLKTLAWVVVSAAVMAALSFITGHKELFNTETVMGANIALVAIKNLLDPKVKNI